MNASGVAEVAFTEDGTETYSDEFAKQTGTDGKVYTAVSATADVIVDATATSIDYVSVTTTTVQAGKAMDVEVTVTDKATDSGSARSGLEVAASVPADQRHRDDGQ